MDMIIINKVRARNLKEVLDVLNAESLKESKLEMHKYSTKKVLF